MRSAADDPEAFYRFSIDRYYPPTVETIPLRDPRWQETQEGSCQWRILEMDDHFGADHARRWAISLLDVSKSVRFDLFAWRNTISHYRSAQRCAAIFSQDDPRRSLRSRSYGTTSSEK